jgi:hypothetical protein
MPYLIGAIFAVVAAYIALWLVVSAIVLFLVPAFLVVLAVCVLGGVVFAPIVAMLTLTGVGTWGSYVATPDDVVAGNVRLLWRKKNEPFSPDGAWPGYLVAQWRLDLLRMWRNGHDALNRWLQALNGFTRDLYLPFLWTPLLIFLYGGWLATVVGALLGAAVVVVLGALVIGPAWVGTVTVIGLVRSVDVLVRRRRKASGSCPKCHWVTMLPAYPCANCKELHRDLRPGWLGVLWHRCRCGVRLPTTVLRATKRLGATCPRCGESLRRGAGVLTDIRLPVFGPMSAGKTRLVYAALVAMRDRFSAVGGTLAFEDPGSRTAFDEATAIIASGASTQKTEQGPLPRPITAHVTNGKREAMLHLFDAAGEYFVDREDNTKLEFLDTAQGLVFVVDPFSVPWVADQLTGARNSRLVAAHPAKEDPERVYHVTVRRLAEHGVTTAGRHLAVVVVKSDLLIDLPFAADLRAGNAREWLNQAGLDNLVLSAERDFAEVRYFTVASVAEKSVESLAPANPFLWLMNAVGFATGSGHRGEQPVSSN